MDHDECRRKVCVVCSKKAKRNLTKTEINFVKAHVDAEFSKERPDYPCGICVTCQIAVNKKIKNQEVKVTVNQLYKSRPPRLLLRSQGLNCQCCICEIAKSNGIVIANSKKKRGRPKSKEQPVETTIKVCSLCLQSVYPGCRHKCSNRNYRRKKVHNMEELLTPTTSERLASRTITRCSDDMKLSTLGPSMKPIVNEPVKKRLFSVDDMCLIRKDNHLSSAQTITLIEDLNRAAGHKVVETYAKTKMHVRNHRLDAFFEHMMIQFTRKIKGTKNSEQFDQHVIVVTDISSFISEVVKVRELERHHCLVKIGMDGGGGFLKICASVFNLMIRDNPQSMKTLAKKFSDTGAKKILIIAIAPETPENFFNMEKIWVAAGLNSLSWDYSTCTIASDLKLLNILLGLMSHSSMHPCWWCDVDKYHLHEKGVQRTIGSLNQLYREFRDAFVPESKAKDFGNVVYPPLIKGDPETPVIYAIPPPELHLMLGPVNQIYDELSNVWTDSNKWLQACHVKQTDYHGGKFEGNDCRKLLRKLDILRELCPQEYEQFIETFAQFDEVVHSCYGNDLLPGYEQNILSFKDEFLKLRISVTPKVHAVFYHIEEFCSITKMGLGPWSEQASESVHQEFSKCWNKYKIKNTDHPLYGEKLLEAVQMFNSQNL